ncbi:MAG: FKBP-type peptidyl-prolyl cis-trans isomerase [Clostridiales Family XIII bacterium]|nr:FKBP-type peptidyl-prolyl cis-trans isomerase [Clostridiales Family XIII bacterium]
MKTIKTHFCIVAALAVLLASLSACAASEAPDPDSSAAASGGEDPASFSYSSGIDENGFWQGITAADYVELYDYNAFSVPSTVYEISDSAVQDEIAAILENYSTAEQITDTAVADGDTVNIDYIGSVDGVEFDGGSTGGAGTDVTIGVTSYIDNFLEQLIGHDPGDTFDVNVTFPEDYGVDNLNGKAAVFVTTVNYIVKTSTPELTDAFIADNLALDYGYTTISEMQDGIYAHLQTEAIQNYIYEYLTTATTVSEVPETLVEYQKNAMLQYYREHADSYGVSLDEFLATYAGISSEDELIETNAENNRQAAQHALVIQAIAEDAKISVTDEDLANYFENQVGSPDYSGYEEHYGLPYLKQTVLLQKVMDYLSEHTVLE